MVYAIYIKCISCKSNFFFSSRRRHTRLVRDWSSDVCSSDLATQSKIAYKILENYNDEVKNFKQVCPKEMIDRLLNRLSLKTKISKAV